MLPKYLKLNFLSRNSGSQSLRGNNSSHGNICLPSHRRLLLKERICSLWEQILSYKSSLHFWDFKYPRGNFMFARGDLLQTWNCLSGIKISQKHLFNLTSSLLSIAFRKSLFAWQFTQKWLSKFLSWVNVKPFVVTTYVQKLLFYSVLF